ncbi:hypothetical protein Tco_1495005, partial [Tanacetum coccineum]
GEEDEKELVEMGEVGEGPFGKGESGEGGSIVVAGVDMDRDAEKEEARRMICTDNAKNHKKTVKAGQTRTREQKECKRAESIYQWSA